MLKTFTVAPERDSVRTAFFQEGQRSTAARLGLEKSMATFPEYVLKQDGVRVAIIRGKEMVCGGEHFAVIPFLPADWAEQGSYAPSNANVPYWDGEQRLQHLGDLLYGLSCGLPITEALDDAITVQDDLDMLDQEQPDDAEDDEFFAGIPEVAYTGQQRGQSKPTPPAKTYPWTFWYRGGDGASHQMILEATYEDAQRAWDALSPVFEMTSRRP